ncbi:hypothetical protein HFN_0941 [Helicobacter fennelliae MRY12-0050]|uniref:Uncharacterized protein n=1 Tax=Helicobacter fennelliae MRY12-0050 TaxID=1325130 RepID=T1D3D0_9HELI|nr:hypothetical protein HFN_0941 [Helicobacter fennelliae MRY12-0050]
MPFLCFVFVIIIAFVLFAIAVCHKSTYFLLLIKPFLA